VPLPRNYPKLEGWLTVTEVATQLKVSRQACHKMMSEGIFSSVHRLGTGLKPIYVIGEAEVVAIKALRETAK
jgi:hypothetical protein